MEPHRDTTDLGSLVERPQVGDEPIGPASVDCGQKAPARNGPASVDCGFVNVGQDFAIRALPPASMDCVGASARASCVLPPASMDRGGASTQIESLNVRSAKRKPIPEPGWSSAGGDMEGNRGDRPALGWNGTGSAETSAVEGDVSPAKQNTSVAPCDREGGGLATDGYGKPVGASARPDPSMREPKGERAPAVQGAAPTSLADSPPAVKRTVGDIKTAPLQASKGGDANTDGLNEPVGVGPLPDLSLQASKGEAGDTVNEATLRDFRRQWLEDIEQSKARGDGDKEMDTDMSLAEAFEQRDQQASAKRRREEPKLEQTVFSSADEPPMALGLTNKNRGAGNPTSIDERPRHDSDDSEFAADQRSLEPPSTEQPQLGGHRTLDHPTSDFPDSSAMRSEIPCAVSQAVLDGGIEPGMKLKFLKSGQQQL